MSLTPLAAGSLSARRNGETFATMRGQLDDLQRQFATGQRSDSYSGLGINRRTSLDARAKLSTIGGYQSAIEGGDLRLKLMSKGLESLAKVSTQQRSQSAPAAFNPGTGGRTQLQQMSLNNLKHAVEVLNTDVNGRYLFSGRADDTRPVIDVEQMLDGAGGQIGLRDVIRAARDLDRGGPTTPGHLTIGPGSPAFNVSEGATNVTNGFILAGQPAPLDSPSIDVGLAGAAGSAALSFSVNAVPTEAETIRFTLGLRDGTSTTIALTARAGGPEADATSFRIGADTTQTGNNLRQAVGLALQKAVSTLEASSAASATERFFDGAVPGAVTWYRGEATAGPTGEPYSLTARNGVPLRIDATQSVGVGARADEPAFRKMLAGFAMIAADTFSEDPAKRDADLARHTALAERSADYLDAPAGTGNVKDVITDLANATTALAGAKERHGATKALLQDALADVESVSQEEVAVSILALQNRLQASYQTTSILSRLSLANYL